MRKTPHLEEISNLVELARWQAKNNPELAGFTFLPDGEEQEIILTLQELDYRAREVATWLQTQARPGDRALMLFPPGLDFIVGLYGCMYAGIVAVIVTPPRPNMALTTVEETAHHAGASLALTLSPFLNSLQNQINQSRLSSLAWFAIDQIPSTIHANAWQAPELSLDSLILLVYTSGSTSAPKGVMVSHKNILSGMKPAEERFFLNPDTVFVGWFPQHHISSIFWYFQILGCSMKMVFMPVSAFIDQPSRWLRAVTRYRSTCSGTLNFGLQYCLERISEEERARLDLSCLKVCILGGERIRADLVAEFIKAFSNCGLDPASIIPVYGLTENFGFASTGVRQNGITSFTLDRIALSQNRVMLIAENPGSNQPYVSCGKPLSDKKIIIVNPDSGMCCPADTIGEIWISGGSIANGYWNNPDETQMNLQAHSADTGEGPYLRSGDLGFLHQGEVVVTGRIKDMVILHGKNFYSQDFERTVEGCHPALVPGGAAAFAITEANEEHLAIICEVKPTVADLEPDEVISTIRQSVGKDQEQSVYLVGLVKAGQIPRTSSGKLKRYVCRDEIMSNRLVSIKTSRLEDAVSQAPWAKPGYVAPSTSIERALVGIWSSVLGIDRIGVNDSFFELGGDSLEATQIMIQAEDVFQIELPNRLQAETPTIANLARMIVELRHKHGNREG